MIRRTLLLIVILAIHCMAYSGVPDSGENNIPDKASRYSMDDAGTFVKPMLIELSLAGNFGEPRPHHFHAGLDMRTQQEEGKVVVAAAEGYVERVLVSPTGYGNALFVRHPNGYTTVYAHLSRFAPQIRAAVKKWQYANHSADVDMRLPAHQMPVSQGQFIAFSGNTGGSYGPHLHFEVRRTDTMEMVDPLEFLGDSIKDTQAPVAHSFMAFPQEGEGLFCGKPQTQTFALSPKALTAWGKVGFGVYADDKMDEQQNTYGVRHTKLFLDGKLLFESDVNNIPADMHRMINSWGNYDYFAEHRRWYLKSFIEPGNKLPILKAGSGQGVVDFNEERDYHFRYELSDYYGNKSEYEFVVRGTKTALPGPSPVNTANLLHYDKANHLSLSGVDIDVKDGSLPYDVQLCPVIEGSGVGMTCRLYNRRMPLFTSATLSFPIQGEGQPDKLYVKADSNVISSRIDGDHLKADITELERLYTVCLDTVAPVIKPAGNIGAHSLLFNLEDKESGIKSVEGTLDGQFILFMPLRLYTLIGCDLSDTPVKPTGKNRKLTLTVTDLCGNKSKYETQVMY